MSTDPPPSITDPRALRAIAHPVRNRILQEIYLAGHTRAADVAARLGIPANQASFHLRQLAKYGLIEPDPEHARDGRDRVWKPVNASGVSVSFSRLQHTPGGKAAVTVFRRQAAERAKQAVERAYLRDSDDQIKISISESALRLTRREAEEFAAALGELEEKWTQLARADDGVPRQTYQVLTFVQPMPDLDAE